MDDAELDRLRDTEDRERFEIRGAEERLAREEAALERRLEDFAAAERRTEAEIAARYRASHWGRDPEPREDADAPER